MIELGRAVGIVLACFVVAYILIVMTAQSQTVPPLQASDYDERLDQLDREAIEHAYVQHVAKLFGTWMTDYSTNPTPFRALTGHRNARQGYIDTMTSIDERAGKR